MDIYLCRCPTPSYTKASSPESLSSVPSTVPVGSPETQSSGPQDQDPSAPYEESNSPKDCFRGADGLWHYLTWHPYNATDGPVDNSNPDIDSPRSPDADYRGADGLWYCPDGSRHPRNINALDGPTDCSNPNSNNSPTE